MTSINAFKQSIKHEPSAYNTTYLHTFFDGCKYGQVYQNATMTLEDMINDFIVFYFPMVEEKQQADEIAIIWHIEDVKSLDDTLTDDQCRKVLKAVGNNHDATIGVTWDTLQVYIDAIKEGNL